MRDSAGVTDVASREPRALPPPGFDGSVTPVRHSRPHRWNGVSSATSSLGGHPQRPRVTDEFRRSERRDPQPHKPGHYNRSGHSRRRSSPRLLQKTPSSRRGPLWSPPRLRLRLVVGIASQRSVVNGARRFGRSSRRTIRTDVTGRVMNSASQQYTGVSQDRRGSPLKTRSGSAQLRPKDPWGEVAVSSSREQLWDGRKGISYPLGGSKNSSCSNFDQRRADRPFRGGRVGCNRPWQPSCFCRERSRPTPQGVRRNNG